MSTPPKGAWLANPNLSMRDLLLHMATNHMDFAEIPVGSFTVTVIISKGEKQEGLRAVFEKYMKGGK